jgi:Fur family transcriptional regulator, iron response regulator
LPKYDERRVYTAGWRQLEWFQEQFQETVHVENREHIRAQLIQHGVRPTAQRMHIAQLVLDRPCHFSADQLLANLRRSGLAVSKATVYNTLNLFSQRGLIREIPVDPIRLLFDSTTHPHHHFYNSATGELSDINSADLRITKLPPLPKGTEAQSIEVLIRIRPKQGE